MLLFLKKSSKVILKELLNVNMKSNNLIKLDSYNRNLDKDKLLQSAMNVYSKGEYNRVYNNYQSKNELGRLEPKVGL